MKNNANACVRWVHRKLNEKKEDNNQYDDDDDEKSKNASHDLCECTVCIC